MDYFAFAQKIGEADQETELLFPDEFDDFDDEAVIDNPEEASDAGFYDRHIGGLRVPTFTAYPVADDGVPRPGVVICPGGGYQILASDKEGHEIARFFNSFGVAAFVVNYRMPRAEDGDQRPFGPLRDAQRALRLVRSRAEQYGVNPEKVGIMGFSAGAHLAATASTLFRDSAETNPDMATYSCRPDFTILVYPVITMQGPVTNAGSRNALLGTDPDERLKDYFSAERQVSPETPPAILIQTNDDVVPVENSLSYYQALRAAGVPVSLHIYPSGGHGYGMRSPVKPLNSWPEAVRNWLESLK